MHPGVPNPVVVYVDDEEENLFDYRRRYSNRLNLRTFSNPNEALAFIRDNPDAGAGPDRRIHAPASQAANYATKLTKPSLS